MLGIIESSCAEHCSITGRRTDNNISITSLLSRELFSRRLFRRLIVKYIVGLIVKSFHFESVLSDFFSFFTYK